MGEGRTRHVLLLLDGVSGIPEPELGDRTPLEVARTPGLDRLVAGGRLGVIGRDPWGRPHATHDLVAAVLGRDPATDPIGAAVLESDGGESDCSDAVDDATAASGAGDDRVLVSVDLVAIEDGRLIRGGSDDLTMDETAAIAEALGPPAIEVFGPSTRVLPAREGRLTLDLDASMAPSSMDLTPPDVVLGEPIERHRPSGPFAAAFRRFTDAGAGHLAEVEVIAVRREAGLPAPTHPWPWGPGDARRRIDVADRYDGQTIAVVRGGRRTRGLGAVLEPVSVIEPGNGSLAARARAVLQAAREHDVVIASAETRDGEPLVEIEAGDVAVSEPEARVAAIERIDREFIVPIASELASSGGAWRVGIVAGARRRSDGGLVAEPVPVVFAGEGFAGHVEATFDEEAAESGELRLHAGDDLLEYLLFGAGVRRARRTGSRGRGVREAGA